ncbi:alginate lyase family protein [Akkermansiaceae bacterium]|nr:alginate lyase family protein [Akkermansiaceae bacterium]
MKKSSITPYFVKSLAIACGVFVADLAQADLVHPGLSHKTSDLDRIKYQVEAQLDPWFSSYQEMLKDSKSGYDYEVRGKASFRELGRDNKVNYREWNSDIRAAYYNAIQWYVTGDKRHAEKCVEIFNAWSGLTNVSSGGTFALSGGTAYIMLEAAEIIKSTSDVWSEEDRKKFEAMLVYPGYSTTQEPEGDTTFYWKSYQGDSGRHGNQGLSGLRTVLAMGVFLDNEVMMQRALRYLKGMPHLAEDLPYPSGPPRRDKLVSSNEYADNYKSKKGDKVEDYGFNEQIRYYIWENGQCQESSRDQQHVFFGLGLIQSMAEIAWNQGEDLYAFSDHRLLLGWEYNLKYNISHKHSYPDQKTPWIPTAESGEFIQRDDRTLRWYSKSISPIGISEFSGIRPLFEQSVAHYIGRGVVSQEDAKWTLRARDISIKESGLEKAGWTNDALGWGALTMRRPAGCYGDPVKRIVTHTTDTQTDQEIPQFSMPVLPAIIQAENYDYSPVNGNGRTYFDQTAENKHNIYRKSESVDLFEIANVKKNKQAEEQTNYCLSDISAEEWLTYTLYVPEVGEYEVSLRYLAKNDQAKVQLSFAGEDKTGEVSMPSNIGKALFSDHIISSKVKLEKGVQVMKMTFSGESGVLAVDSIQLIKR